MNLEQAINQRISDIKLGREWCVGWADKESKTIYKDGENFILKTYIITGTKLKTLLKNINEEEARKYIKLYFEENCEKFSYLEPRA